MVLYTATSTSSLPENDSTPLFSWGKISRRWTKKPSHNGRGFFLRRPEVHGSRNSRWLEGATIDVALSLHQSTKHGINDLSTASFQPANCQSPGFPSKSQVTNSKLNLVPTDMIHLCRKNPLENPIGKTQANPAVDHPWSRKNPSLTGGDLVTGYLMYHHQMGGTTDTWQWHPLKAISPIWHCPRNPEIFQDCLTNSWYKDIPRRQNSMHACTSSYI